MSQQDGRCATCEYYEKPDLEASSQMKVCKRYPPVWAEPHLGVGWQQPEVGKDDRCGEWLARRAGKLQ